MEVDHIVIGVADLRAAADRLDQRFGLVSVPGGRHRGWGTANLVVPLGGAYLELVSVVDPGEAATSTFGRWIAAMIAAESGWGWAVRTDAIGAVAARLGLTIDDGSRIGVDGRRLTWQLVGVEHASQSPALPFFIQWGADTPFPGTAPATQATDPVSLTHIAVSGDRQALLGWLGSSPAGVTVVPGRLGVTGLQIKTASGVRHLNRADLTD